MKNDKWLFAMTGVHALLDDFSINIDERIVVLSDIRDFYLNSFSNTKETKKNISLFYRKNKLKIENTLTNNEYTFFQERTTKNKIHIEELYTKNIDFNINNYIHMFLNRFFETGQNLQETVIYDLLIRYYESLKFRKK